MVKKKEEKEKATKQTDSGKKEALFDYKDYVEKTFENPKAFLYYVLVNDLTLKSKEEVDKTYKLFKQVGGN